jgi:Lon protease-like protein
MTDRLLPLFPLEVVVLPRTRLPLHIFEERYKEMVGLSIRDSREFGIVLAKEEGIAGAGCTVKVEKLLHQYPDGRMDILAHGERRFEILHLNEEKDYLRAEVSFYDDEDTVEPAKEARAQALVHYQSLNQLGAARAHSEPDFNDAQLSFQLAQAVPDVDFLHALLLHRSEAARLKHLNDYLAEYLPKQKSIERVKDLAPKNGFAHKPSTQQE